MSNVCAIPNIANRRLNECAIVCREQPPPASDSTEALMDSSAIELRLSELRRELEEILAMLSSDSTLTANQFFERAPSENVEKPASEQTDTELLNDALVVITEFGEATPEILQMWLSIDFNRATRILTRLEADGLISPKGKVRHKAFELLRSTLPVAD